MGRTIKPYSRQIESLYEDRFKDFRRGLAKKHQSAFDEIMRIGKRQLVAGVMASNPYSIETVLLSAYVELKSDLEEMKLQIQKLSKNDGSDF
ncbi:hypothetical protein EHQ23_09080 [Leptospira bourretii]|uniref:DUF8156 domain-containing protein n=1 Tax=Leptospira bourretii TaxID=2484962 RepID=A0A4R9IKX0_9LEPT|nr:hypothetical protein [Leptospira bourretii]TGK84839.1 hypothetical protein EHQ23_09080 [Leptospira bourretii]TGK90606.1 hypothetical protein EHQ26_10680 [Leptospira bourretii]TGL33709.1 hypothetical protein EHQ45_09425 [Leptospira bourretii]